MANLRILIAEDNPINQRLLVALLKVQGHTGAVVNDGEKALRCLESQAFDLILLDVQMPVMDGLQALQQIRMDEEQGRRTARMPVIMVTANDLPGDRERFIERGADGYIAKPVKTEALQLEIARVLRLF